LIERINNGKLKLTTAPGTTGAAKQERQSYESEEKQL